MKKYVLLIIILFSAFIYAFAQDSQKYDCFRVLNTKAEIKEFLFKRYAFEKKDFESGDIIADVGAGNGYVSGMISCFYNNLNFYIQDIDTSCCNLREVKKVFDHYMEIKGKNDTKYEIVIGKPDDTGLPNNKFNKIIMCSVFHFLPDPYTFFKGLNSKLTKEGKLYLINFFAEDESSRNKLMDGENVYYEPTLNEMIEPIEKAGFKLIKVKMNKHSSYNKIIFGID